MCPAAEAAVSLAGQRAPAPSASRRYEARGTPKDVRSSAVVGLERPTPPIPRDDTAAPTAASSTLRTRPCGTKGEQGCELRVDNRREIHRYRPDALNTGQMSSPSEAGNCGELGWS